jgi:AcrR family transcriptional regulator
MESATRTRHSTASARRDEVIDAAIIEFAAKGLHGTATDDIARRAGISQPYIFRLFGTKKELFLAASDRICTRITAVFTDAAAANGRGTVLYRMGTAFHTLLAERVELMMLLQSFVGSEDPDVRAAMQLRMRGMFALVKRLSGEEDKAVETFMAQGMLLAVLRACDLPDVLGLPDWQTIPSPEHCWPGDRAAPGVSAR